MLREQKYRGFLLVKDAVGSGTHIFQGLIHVGHVQTERGARELVDALSNGDDNNCRETTNQERNALLCAYYDGIRSGVMRAAHWIQGAQVVGNPPIELQKVLDEIDREEAQRL